MRISEDGKASLRAWAIVLLILALLWLLLRCRSALPGEAADAHSRLDQLALNLLRVVAGSPPEADVSTGVILWARTPPGWGHLVLTSAHAVRQGPVTADYSLQLGISGKRTWLTVKDVQVLGKSTTLDLALLRVRPAVLSHGVLLARFEEVMTARIGDEIVVASIPGGRMPFLTFGRLANKMENIDGTPAWATTAQMMPGSSGGGVFWKDRQGRYRLIGACLCINGQRAAGGTVYPVAHEAFFVPAEFIWAFIRGAGFERMVSTND